MPVFYKTNYFTLHLRTSQNEKLIVFGVTQVAAVDAFSGKPVASATMPIKNKLKIYEGVYRDCLSGSCIWEKEISCSLIGTDQ